MAQGTPFLGLQAFAAGKVGTPVVPPTRGRGGVVSPGLGWAQAEPYAPRGAGRA